MMYQSNSYHSENLYKDLLKRGAIDMIHFYEYTSIMLS